jgi:hypothetical protein
MGDRMATIIHLNPSQRPAVTPAAGETPPECKIVIFPGVRIERQETPYFAEVPAPVTGDGAEPGSRPRKSS